MSPTSSGQPAAWMNTLLIGVNLLAFLLERSQAAFMPLLQLDVHTLDLYRFVSYAFLHLGWAHLLMNMAVLYVLGRPVNQRLGELGYLGFYLAGAVFSGVGFIVSGGSAVVGASGAVGAVMAAYLVLLPRSNLTLSLGVAVLEVPSMSFVVVFFLYNVIMSLATRVGAEQVAYEAHVAGMLFGFALLLVLLLVRLIPRHEEDLLSLFRRVRQ